MDVHICANLTETWIIKRVIEAFNLSFGLSQLL